jgi:hypothetical protein
MQFREITVYSENQEKPININGKNADILNAKMQIH